MQNISYPPPKPPAMRTAVVAAAPQRQEPVTPRVEPGELAMYSLGAALSLFASGLIMHMGFDALRVFDSAHSGAVAGMCAALSAPTGYAAMFNARRAYHAAKIVLRGGNT